jgi:uncharacterized DUF497 family protein
MKRFIWDVDKNEWLKKERGVSFENVLVAITVGDLLDTVVHPNQAKYPNQRMYVVRINDYAYLVPFVEAENEIALKTIIPNRQATQNYLRGKRHEI